MSLAYKNSLELARENQLESIAFPLISSGIYGYPKEEALDIAVTIIREFLKENEMKVSLVVYDKYVDVSRKRRDLLVVEKAILYEYAVYPLRRLDLRIDEKLEELFSQMLLK